MGKRSTYYCTACKKTIPKHKWSRPRTFIASLVAAVNRLIEIRTDDGIAVTVDHVICNTCFLASLRLKNALEPESEALGDDDQSQGTQESDDEVDQRLVKKAN